MYKKAKLDLKMLYRNQALVSDLVIDVLLTSFYSVSYERFNYTIVYIEFFFREAFLMVDFNFINTLFLIISVVNAIQ